MKASVIGEVMMMDNDDLNRLVEAVRSRRSILSREVKRQFHVGDRVSFSTKKRGLGLVKGTVWKINRKNIVVETEYAGRWNVSPSLLTAL